MKMITQSLWLFVIVCTHILWNISVSLAGPVRSVVKHPDKLSHDNVHNYLMEFGYLPKSDIETGNLRTEAQLKDAIRNLQRFGNIPETGEIDNRTRKLILMPRCGVPDKRNAPDFSPDNLGGSRWYRDRGGGGVHRRRSKRFVIQGAKWDHTDLTWSLVNQTMSTLNAGDVRRVLTKALAVWEQSSKLTFREVYSKQADIQVLFARQNHGDGYDFDGPGMVLAHAFYPGEGRGGDAHFDEEENWLLNGTHTDEGTNLMGVAVHEFGHSLGLGHSSAVDAIMYPWYQGYQINGELPDDDKRAIQQLYGVKEKQWGPYNPGFRPTRPTTTTTTTTQRPLRYYPDRREPVQPQEPRREPTYPHEPRREPTYPQEPRREPTYPQDPRRDPSYPQTPRRQPTYPEDPRRKPTYPEDPRRRPSWERPDSRPSNPRYPQNDPRYPQQFPKTTPRHHYHNHNHHPHHDPRTHVDEVPEHNPRTEAPPTRYPTQRYHNHPATTVRPRKVKPDGCKIHYDAISMLRRELFIFSDQYLWRIGERGLYKGYPHETRRLWSKLPENFTRIDAVYENQKGKIVFFIGQRFYVFNSAELEYSRPLTDLGLPANVEKIDAALVWGHNNRTYLYSDTRYWRLDEDTGKVELDYPRDMSIWVGIGYYIDSAFQYSNGKTYFFKGQAYWEFNDSKMRVAHFKPKLSAQKWMRCPRVESNDIDDDSLNAPLVSERNFPISEAGPTSGSRRSWSLDILLTIVPLFMYISLVSY